jgi:putative membrane protein insertion efficiency factor
MSVKRGMLFLIDSYKRWISPLLPAACRFEPTCSVYAREAIEYHGVWRGTRLTVWRLLRCQPFSRGGFDPVPTGHEETCRSSCNSGVRKLDG